MMPVTYNAETVQKVLETANKSYKDLEAVLATMVETQTVMIAAMEKLQKPKTNKLFYMAVGAGLTLIILNAQTPKESKRG